MNEKRWITPVLVLVGIGLIVGGGVMFSANGLGQMGGSYGMGCDPDESVGSGPADNVVSPATAKTVSAQYLGRYRGKNLEVAEIMEFQRNFYVQVREKKTGRFAF